MKFYTFDDLKDLHFKYVSTLDDEKRDFYMTSRGMHDISLHHFMKWLEELEVKQGHRHNFVVDEDLQ